MTSTPQQGSNESAHGNSALGRGVPSSHHCTSAQPVSTTQPSSDPAKLIQEADRLAWLRAWGAAEPLYAEAEKIFAARGDQRNVLYAQISVLRGQLPRLPVAEVSARLAEYLEHPLVRSDERLRLRALVIKGETDQDLDPSMAAKSWREAQSIAEKLGDAAWANRAKGELGLVAFLQGDVGASVIGLGQALKIAQTNGDVSSQARFCKDLWARLRVHRSFSVHGLRRRDLRQSCRLSRQGRGEGPD